MEITPSTPHGLDQIRKLEQATKEQPQVHIRIEHALYAGLYYRTAYMPQDVLMVGAYIRIPTLLIISGNVTVHNGSQSQVLSGTNVIRANENRKQAFLAHAPTTITMVFATKAKTVQEAEEEFTNESDSLQSRQQGEELCLEQLPPLALPPPQ